MDLNELAKAAIEKINYKSPIQIDRDPVLKLIVPMKGSKQPESTFLAGRKSPKGKVLGFHSKGLLVVNFNAIDVLAWCVAHGADVEIRNQHGEKIAID